MRFPDYFEQAPVVEVYDPLSELLGAPVDGLLTYEFADAVKLAGHACPTVAGAFMVGRAGLATLYPDGPAERGQIEVTLPAPEAEGTTGVTAQVLTLLTGAAGDNGFKGLGGRFARNNRLHFSEDGHSGAPIQFRRMDTGASVRVGYDPSPVPMAPGVREQLMTIMQGHANEADVAAFGRGWQARVSALLLEHADDPNVVQVTANAAEAVSG